MLLLKKRDSNRAKRKRRKEAFDLLDKIDISETVDWPHLEADITRLLPYMSPGLISAYMDTLETIYRERVLRIPHGRESIMNNYHHIRNKLIRQYDKFFE